MTDDVKSRDIPHDEGPFAELPLGALPRLDVAPQRAEQIRRRAHAILRAEQAAHQVGSFAYRYRRSIEPALLIGLGVCQLIWAAHGTWLLFHR
jgi:hypothetical protein